MHYRLATWNDLAGFIGSLSAEQRAGRVKLYEVTTSTGLLVDVGFACGDMPPELFDNRDPDPTDPWIADGEPYLEVSVDEAGPDTD